MADRSTELKAARKAAVQLIVLLGIVSLCGDIVYEGGAERKRAIPKNSRG